jgi:plastocyanin
MKTFLMLLLSAVAFASVAGACSGGDDSGSKTPDANRPDPGQMTKVDAVPSGAPEIDQDGLKFKPDSLSVKAGQTVFFSDGESAIHTVTINGKNLSGTMHKDDVMSWTPPAAGEYKITCDYHPQMRSTVTVAP